MLNTVRLGAAPGSITGIVRSSTGDALGNVKVVATSGELVKETTTPTTGNAGTFLLDKLESPRTWVLTFTRDGFSSQTIALDLGAGQATNRCRSHAHGWHRDDHGCGVRCLRIAARRRRR